MTTAADSRRSLFFRVTLVCTIALAPMVWWAACDADPISYCPVGLAAIGPRCCGEGQRLELGLCTGRPTRCAPTQELRQDGCVATPRRILIEGQSSNLMPEPTRLDSNAPKVARPFEIDAFETTVASYESCVAAGGCPALPSPMSEPGSPVRQVNVHEAMAYCNFAGGRLPTLDELVLAASGPEGRRYPWGLTGAVCRRAAWGLVSGPCGSEGVAPELAGSRPDGATPTGVFDLAGNVRELTQDGSGTADQVRVYGGSFRSLGSFHLLAAPPVTSMLRSGRADDVGFRCAYDVSRKEGGG